VHSAGLVDRVSAIVSMLKIEKIYKIDVKVQYISGRKYLLLNYFKKINAKPTEYSNCRDFHAFLY